MPRQKPASRWIALTLALLGFGVQATASRWIALTLAVLGFGFQAAVSLAQPLPSAVPKIVGRSTPGRHVYPLQSTAPILLRSQPEKTSEAAVLEGDFAYFITERLSRIVKLDLRSFQRVAALTLFSQGEPIPQTVFRHGQQIYFMHRLLGFQSQPLLVKFDLPSFQIVHQLSIPGGYPTESVVLGDFAFLWNSSTGNQILRVDLQNFVLDGTLETGLTEVALAANALTDGEFVYFTIATQPARIVKVDPQALTVLDTLILDADLDSPRAGFIADGAGYLAFSGSTSHLVKFDLASFQVVDRLDLPESPSSHTTALYAEADLAYVSVGATVFELDLRTFSLGRALPLEMSCTVRGLSLQADQLYAVCNSEVTSFVRIQRDSFTFAQRTFLQPEELSLGNAVVKDNLAYVPVGGSVARLLKIDLEAQKKLDVLYLRDERARLQDGFIVGDFAYFGTATRPSRIVKIDLNTFTQVTDQPMASDLWALQGLTGKGDFGYFVDSFDQSILVKVDLNRLTEVKRLKLPRSDGLITGGALSGGFGYFSLNGSNGQLLKVRLSDLARVGTLRLHPGTAGALAMEVSGQVAYVGLRFGDRVKGKIVKVDLRAFRKLGELLLKPGEGAPRSLVNAGTFVYTLTTKNKLRRFDANAFRLVTEPEPISLPEHFYTGKAYLWGTNLFIPYFYGWRELEPAGAIGIVELGLQAGIIKATETFFQQSLRPRSIGFHAHAADGQVRLALYDADKNLLWQCPPRTLTRANAVLTVPISAGTPAQLPVLPAGTYYLAWQISSQKPVPSFSRGIPGDGWKLVWKWGDFPQIAEGTASTREIWTQFLAY